MKALDYILRCTLGDVLVFEFKNSLFSANQGSPLLIMKIILSKSMKNGAAIITQKKKWAILKPSTTPLIT